MLVLLVERFRGGDPGPVYKRLKESGRELPEGLRYVGSWVTRDLTECYQVMEYDDRGELEVWLAKWADLVDFDVIPVMTSAEAAAAVDDRP